MASFNAAAARGDAAQAASDRKKKSHTNGLKASSVAAWFGQETFDQNQQSPEPYSTQQTTRHAVTDSKMSAKALQQRWKHGIKIALFWCRAATTRAVLPRTSARAEWLLASLTNRATSHWVRARLLDGGDDDDADTGTDTTAPDDDNDDIVSFTNQQSPALQFSNL